MRLREFTDPDKYFPPETQPPTVERKPENNRNDHADEDTSPGVTRKPDIRERPRRAAPVGFSLSHCS